jgi:hypothetical protein
LTGEMLGKNPTSWGSSDPYEAPQFVEINLDAEIGSYQDDFSDVPVVRVEPAPDEPNDPPLPDDSQ